nr:MAG TPA: hypothetical protein [Caudoviricetes sp.]
MNESTKRSHTDGFFFVLFQNIFNKTLTLHLFVIFLTFYKSLLQSQIVVNNKYTL